MKATLLLALLAVLMSGEPPRCFGAAARASERCANPALRLSVTPTPAQAPLETSSPCTPAPASVPPACAFGAPAAAASVALLGDSHSVHWRAPLDVVAHAQRWRGVSLYHSRCPFTAAYSTLPPAGATACQQWKLDVRHWLVEHPEVTTVITSSNAGSGVAVPPGADRFETKVTGFLDAWTQLPPTVSKIVVLRDVPRARLTTPGCVERAFKRRRAPGQACALSRAGALPPDPAAEAARRLSSARVQLVDLTRFMCDRRRCYPVVGGALVHRDVGHMTRTFATTLAPYLLAELSPTTATPSPPPPTTTPY